MKPSVKQSLCIPRRDPGNRAGSVHNAGKEGGSPEKRLGRLRDSSDKEERHKGGIIMQLFLSIFSISYSYGHANEIYCLWAWRCQKWLVPAEYWAW